MSYREIWTCDYCGNEIKDHSRRMILSLKPCKEPENEFEKVLLSEFTMDICPRCANKFGNLMRQEFGFDTHGMAIMDDDHKIFKED